MHDALEAERLGIPAVAVITDRFTRSADLVAKINGLPGYPYAVIGHPIAGDSDDALRAKAEIALERIVPLLLERSTG